MVLSRAVVRLFSFFRTTVSTCQLLSSWVHSDPAPRACVKQQSLSLIGLRGGRSDTIGDQDGIMRMRYIPTQSMHGRSPPLLSRFTVVVAVKWARHIERRRRFTNLHAPLCRPQSSKKTKKKRNETYFLFFSHASQSTLPRDPVVR